MNQKTLSQNISFVEFVMSIFVMFNFICHVCYILSLLSYIICHVIVCQSSFVFCCRHFVIMFSFILRCLSCSFSFVMHYLSCHVIVCQSSFVCCCRHFVIMFNFICCVSCSFSFVMSMSVKFPGACSWTFRISTTGEVGSCHWLVFGIKVWFKQLACGVYHVDPCPSIGFIFGWA